jgi:hypothetical protein
VGAPDESSTWQRGLGDGFTLAVELVVTPLLFAALGYALGSVLGARLALTAAFGGIGFVGSMLRTYYAYLARCAYDEQGKPWTRSRR